MQCHQAWTALVVAGVAFVTLAAFVAPAGAQPPFPPDFRVDYRWYGGSMPPPYHHEYTVTVDASGKGSMVMVPDYPGAGTPSWTETFAVAPAELSALYRRLVDRGVLAKTWRQRERVPVGGSYQHLTVTADGRRVDVKDFVIAEQQAAADAIHDTVREIVPKGIREKLDRQRQQYVAEQERKRD